MFPSQRAQYIFRIPSANQTTDTPPNTSDDRISGRAGNISKIEIRHTKLSAPPTVYPASNSSSINYLTKANRKVTFNASTINEIDSEGTRESNVYPGLNLESFGSHIPLANGLSPTPASNNVNKTFGQVAIQALCNRGSVVDELGVYPCTCQLQVRDNEDVDLERLKTLDPETQKEELCKLIMKLVEAQAEKNERLLEVKAQQKLVVAKPVKAPKVRHIICVGGRTLDGREIPIGKFPNSFAEVNQLVDLHKDPPGFKRFTAKFDMKGFRDDEISLTNERNILRVMGIRRKSAYSSEKQIVEEIVLPPGVYADTLKIGRNGKGVLIVQEPWKF